MFARLIRETLPRLTGLLQLWFHKQPRPIGACGIESLRYSSSIWFGVALSSRILGRHSWMTRAIVAEYLNTLGAAALRAIGLSIHGALAVGVFTSFSCLLPAFMLGLRTSG